MDFVQPVSKKRFAGPASRRAIVQEDVRSFIKRSKIRWKKLEGQKLLIAGANGFLPSYMADTIAVLNDEFLGEPCRMIAATHSPVKPIDRIGYLLGRKEFSFIFADVSKRFEIPPEVSFLVHGASPASPKSYLAKPIETMDANVNCMRTMLDYSLENEVESMLFISSGAVNAENAPPGHIPTPEDYPGNVLCNSERSCYSEAKRYCETLCYQFHKVHGTPIKTARPFHNYGPGLRLDDGRVMADFMRDALGGGPIKINSAGTTLMTFCYAADTAEAFWRILLSDENGEAFNVASEGPEITVRTLAEKMAQLSVPPMKVLARPEDEKPFQKEAARHTRADISKIKERLGWVPATPLKVGLRRTLEWHRSR